MFTQEDYEQLIKNYNEDYLYLLIRASQNSYECLISSFMMLRNLYDVIVKFQDSGKYRFQILPYPLSFRANDDLLKKMGFDEEGVRNIYGFLEFVKETHGKEFEECLEGSVYNLCKRNPGDQPWRMKS
ncbi:MAG: hypothetical protein HY282_08905 [Nitrospirae bacterium]|nr:hypothetical protein [Candidatus Manganitrophaceae bacterium]